MSIKKISAAVMAAAVLATSAPVTGLSNPFGVTASAAAEAESAIPQNLRLEGNSIVWDEVEEARGYVLRTFYEGQERTKAIGSTSFNLNRFLREQALPYGNYEFTVCICTKNFGRGKWSAPFTFNYAPGLSAPTNIKLEEDEYGNPIISWTPVEGAFRYNVRMFYYRQDGSYAGEMDYLYELGDSNSLRIEDYARALVSNGHQYHYDDYSFSFQTMDRDYNFSEWSDPIAAHYEISPKEYLPTPQNVRLDESGDNILWDPVEGADSYSVTISTDGNNSLYFTSTTTCSEAKLNDWKRFSNPFKGSYGIVVRAENESLSSLESNMVTVDFSQECDETIKMPDVIQVKDGIFSLNDTEFWAIFSMNGSVIANYGSNLSANSQIDPQELPEGNYDVELYISDESHKFNSKTYKVTLDTSHDETIWVPELYHWGSGYIRWDYDPIMDGKSYFWVRARQGENIVDLERSGSYYYRFLPDGEYAIEVCACQNGKLGPWSEPIIITKHTGSTFDKDDEKTTEVETPLEATEIPEGDRITSITINPAFNMKNKNGELDLTKIKIKAKEIYDEEGLQRASEALGKIISGNTHYNLLDLTLLYNGKDFSNGYNGLVQVIIPIPKGHRDKTFSCYRLVEVNGKMTKELISGEQTEDSYIIYLEHFSEYALVAAPAEEEHVHTWNNGEVTKQPTTSSEGVKTYTCTVCSETKTEAIPKQNSSSSGGSGSKPSGGNGRPSKMTNKETSAEIESTESGGTARIDGNILILPEIIKEAVERNVDLEVAVDRNFTWNIDTDKLGEIDTVLRLSVTKVNADPDKLLMIEKSFGSINNADLSFSTYAKNLGTGATLTVRTSERSATSAKMFANLYKINADGDLEFVAAAPIDEDGYATLPITETAAYTVITSTETKKPGDINNDCKVDMSDLTAMLRKYVSSQSLSRATDFKMDYNNDGQCNMSDITALLRAYVYDKV